MRLKAMMLALACACGLSMPAARAQDAPLDTVKRTGQWVVNFDDDSCQLLAEFGAPQDRMVLQFTRYSLGEATDVAVMGQRVDGGDPWFKVKLDFGLGARPVESEAGRGALGRLPAIFVIGARLDGWRSEGAASDEAPQMTPAQEAAVTRLKIWVGNKKPFQLEFGPLDKPMAIMRQCLNDLVESWGYDPVVVRGLSRHLTPISSPGTWFGGDDFPATALAKAHNALLRFRLDVDAKGNVTACRILARTKPDDFAQATCRQLMNRGRFRPALDAAGQPVRAFYLGSIYWKA